MAKGDNGGGNGGGPSAPASFWDVSESYSDRDIFEQQAEKTTEALNTDDDLDCIDPTAWFGVEPPPQEWLINGWIPDKQVTLLTGHGGVGKSIVLLQLLMAVATGRRWMNIPTGHPKRVFGLFCEDSAQELHRRVRRICQKTDMDESDLELVTLVSRVDKTINDLVAFKKFATRGARTKLFQTLVDYCLTHGVQLLTIDTIADVFMGEQINLQQVRSFIAEMRQVAIAIDGAVLLSGHPSVEGIASGRGFSGSVAWHNSVRSRLYMTRPEEPEGGFAEESPFFNVEARHRRIISQKKLNYGDESNGMKIECEDGVFFRLNDATGDAIDGISQRVAQNQAEDAFMACVEAKAAIGGTLSASTYASNYAVKIFQGMAACEGVSKKRLHNAMQRLLEQGKLRISEEGTPSKRREVLIKNEQWSLEI